MKKSEKTTRELIDLSQMRIKVVINEFLLFCMFDPFHLFLFYIAACFISKEIIMKKASTFFAINESQFNNKHIKYVETME
jgi:hypothetical protein